MQMRLQGLRVLPIRETRTQCIKDRIFSDKQWIQGVMANRLICCRNLVALTNHMLHLLWCLHPLMAAIQDLQVNQVLDQLDLGQVDSLISHPWIITSPVLTACRHRWFQEEWLTRRQWPELQVDQIKARPEVKQQVAKVLPGQVDLSLRLLNLCPQVIASLVLLT